MAELVQLSHTGRQKYIGNRRGKHYLLFPENPNMGICYWNKETGHVRKFLKTKGKYLKNISNKNDYEGELFFWGEWEPCSIFNKLKAYDRNVPNAIHYPVLCCSTKGENCGQNTDPYVFGDHFHYAVCKQRGQLTNLAKHSIILFGTEYPNYKFKGKMQKVFALDTVFVVDSSIPAKDFEKYKANYNAIYKQVTISKLNNYSTNESKYKLYNGLMYNESKEVFSFFPCKVNIDGKTGFKRVILTDKLANELNLVIGPGVTASIRQYSIDALDVCTKISNEILDQGCYLGIYAEEPSIHIDVNRLDYNTLYDITN